MNQEAFVKIMSAIADKLHPIWLKADLIFSISLEYHYYDYLLPILCNSISRKWKELWIYGSKTHKIPNHMYCSPTTSGTIFTWFWTILGSKPY